MLHKNFVKTLNNMFHLQIEITLNYISIVKTYKIKDNSYENKR